MTRRHVRGPAPPPQQSELPGRQAAVDGISATDMHLRLSENAAKTEQPQPGVKGAENSRAENQSKQVSPLESGKPSSAAASSDHKGTEKGGKNARRRQRVKDAAKDAAAPAWASHMRLVEAMGDSGDVAAAAAARVVSTSASPLVGEIPTATNTAVAIQATSVAANGSTEDPPAGSCTALSHGSMLGDADDPEKPYYACPACEQTFARWHMCEAHVEAAGKCREALRISHPRCKWPDGLFQWHQADEKTCRMACHYRYLAGHY